MGHITRNELGDSLNTELGLGSNLKTSAKTFVEATNELHDQFGNLSVFVNPKSFGCKGDGITDDTTNFQNAINSLTNGGVVQVPKGTFVISSALVVSSNVKIMGISKYSSIISNTTSNSTFTNSGSQSDIEFENIGFVGNKQGSTQCFINLGNITTLRIKNCSFDKPGASGVQIQNSTDLIIEKSTFSHGGWNGSWGGGLDLVACSNFIVEKNRSINNDGSGININGCNDFIVTKNICLTNGVCGITVNGNAYDGEITSNICNNNGTTASGMQDGINGHRLNHCMFINNICKNNAFNGISLDGTDGGTNLVSTNHIIEGNYCYSNGSHGLYIYYTKYSTIKNNRLEFNTTEGLRLEGGIHNEIASNHVLDSGKGTSAYVDIYLDLNSNDCTIKDNKIGNVNASNSRRGIDLWGSACTIGWNDSSLWYGIGFTTVYYIANRTSHKYLDKEVAISKEFKLSDTTPADDILITLPLSSGIFKAELIYTESTSTDTGVALQIGKIGTPNYFYDGVTETSKTLGYINDITSLITNSGILDPNTTLTVHCANGKVGTGKIKVKISLLSPRFYV